MEGLEALNNLAQLCCNYLDNDENAICKGPNHKQRCENCGQCKMFQWEETIEKELKALEIIKEKNINVSLFKKCCNSSYEEYKESWLYFHKGQFKSLNDKLLTQEAYELLKEVL